MVEEIIKKNVEYTGTYGDVGEEYEIDWSDKQVRINLPHKLKETIEQRQQTSLENATLYFGPGAGLEYVVLTDDTNCLEPPEKFYVVFGAEKDKKRLQIDKDTQRVFEEREVKGRVVYVGMKNHVRIYDYNRFKEMQQSPS